MVVRAKSEARGECGDREGRGGARGEGADAVGRRRGWRRRRRARSQMAAGREANLALISMPGEYAAAEAEKALQLGLNVMLFSDNVALADEVALKRPRARRATRDGPRLRHRDRRRHPARRSPTSCGAAPSACVGASGTGLQQVTALVRSARRRHFAGDRHRRPRPAATEVGGITMLQGWRRWRRDRETKVIVLVSKPPAAAVAAKVLAAARKVRKPVVVNFVGAAPAQAAAKNLHPVARSRMRRAPAVALARGGKRPRARAAHRASCRRAAPRARPALRARPVQRRHVLLRGVAPARRSARPGVVQRAGRPRATSSTIRSGVRGHTVVDLGDDVFTRGRPHPMIDQRLRNERMVQEAADPEVAVILLRRRARLRRAPRPGGEMAPAIAAARAARRSAAADCLRRLRVRHRRPIRRASRGRKPRCATAGVILADSNAEAVRIAAAIAQAGPEPDRRALFGKPLSVRERRARLVRRRDRRAGGAATQRRWAPPAGGDAGCGACARAPRRRTRGRSGEQRGVRGLPRRAARARRASASRARCCPAWPSAAPARRPADRVGAHVRPDARRGRRRDPLRRLGGGRRRARARWPRRGEIAFAPCHHHAAVGPMAGIISPSMPVWIVRNATHGNRAFCNLNEGLGKVLRFGANSPEVIERLQWMATMLAPALRSAAWRRWRADRAQAAHRPGAAHGRRGAQPQRRRLARCS